MIKENKKTPEIRFPGFTEDWEQRKVSEITSVAPFKPYLSDIEDGGEYEVIQQGDKPILGRANGKPFMEYEKTTLFGDHTLSLYKTKSPFFVASDGLKILYSDKMDGYFYYYLLEKYKPESEGYKRHFSILKECECAFPKSSDEQKKIGDYFDSLDNLITLHQRKCDALQTLKKSMLQKMFPKKGSSVPEIRFPSFTEDWEQRKFGDMYEKVSRKNDMTYGTEDIISVANMYYKPDAVVKNEEYLKTYNIFELGDIAFEGNKSKSFAHGRFVENTIGNGIVSHVFDVFKPIVEYDLSFWKHYINCEGVMGPIMTRVTKASTMMTNLVAKDFLKESISVPSVEEQQRIGAYLDSLDNLITLHQRKCDTLKELKKGMLQKMFV